MCFQVKKKLFVMEFPFDISIGEEAGKIIITIFTFSEFREWKHLTRLTCFLNIASRLKSQFL